jgi:hypothetical protein
MSGKLRAATSTFGSICNLAVLATSLAACGGTAGGRDLSTSGFSPSADADGSPSADGGVETAACAAVQDFQTTSTSATAIALTWTGASGYTITLARKSYCGTDAYATLATLPAGASSYSDSSVQASWVYWYKITADDGQGHTSESALATQATASPALGCPGGSPPQSSEVDENACAPVETPDGGSTPPAPDAGATPPVSGSVPLDCTHSTQQQICDFVSTTMKLKSAPATLSSACASPANVVAVNPGNFASVLASIQPGHTAVFAAGTYSVPAPITLVDGVSYCGNEADPSQVVLENSDGFFFNNGSGGTTGMTIAGFTMNGGGVYVGINAKFSNVFVQHNVIENCQTSGGDLNYGAAVSGANVGNMTIADNYIYNTLSGIRLWQFSGNVNVTDNEVSDTLWDDLAAQGSETDATGAHLRIARNGFTETHRITMEMYIPAALSVLIEDNAIVQQQVWAYFTGEGTFPMGISMPYAPNGVTIRNNWLIGSAGAGGSTNGAYTDGDHGLAGIETYGPMSITNNVFQYWTGVFLEAAGGPSMSITNNSICDALGVQTQDGGFTGYAGTFTNDGCVRGANNYAVPQP